MDFVAFVSPAEPGPWVAWMVLYIGPEVFMPVLSAIAGAVGILLMFWQRVIGIVSRAWRSVFGRRG